MKIVNGSKKVIFLPFGNQMISILPENVSDNLVANKELVRATIISALPNQVGLVTYSSAELALINEVSGAAPFIYETLELAIEKLLPNGFKPVVEQRTILGGETVKIETEIGSTNSPAVENGEELQKLIEENESLKNQLKTTEEVAKANKTRVGELEEELKNAKIAASQPVEDVETKKKLQDAESVIKKLQDGISEEQEANAKLKKELEEAQKSASTYMSKVSEIEGSKTEEVQKLMSQVTEQSSTISKQAEEINQLKAQIENVGSGTDNSEELNKAQEELKKAQEEVAKFKGLLANTVKVNGLTWNGEQNAYVKIE